MNKILFKDKIYFLVVLFVLAVEVVFVLFKIINRPGEIFFAAGNLKEKIELPKTEYVIVDEEKIEEISAPKKIFSQPAIETEETAVEQKEDLKEKQAEQPPREEIEKRKVFIYEGWFLLKEELYAMIKDVEMDVTHFVSEGEMIDEFKVVTITAQEVVLLSKEEESVALKLSPETIPEEAAGEDIEKKAGVTQQEGLPEPEENSMEKK